MTNPTNSDNTIASASNSTKPYSNGTRILVFGVHGTANGPDNVTNVTQTIANAVVNNPNSGRVSYDSRFSWEQHSGYVNQEEGRMLASWDLKKHVLNSVDAGLRDGSISKNTPLVLNLVGFSHGGNVAIQAVDDIAEGLKKRGLAANTAIHLTTLSTPAYTLTLLEHPDAAAREAKKDGVRFAHTHFAVHGDRVITAANGSHGYDTKVTDNYMLPGIGLRNRPDLYAQDGVTNHGLPQDSQPHMDAIAAKMAARFRGLAPPVTDLSPSRHLADASVNAVENSVKAEQVKAPASLETPAEKQSVAVKENNESTHSKYYSQALEGLDKINLAGKDRADVAMAIVKSASDAGFDPKKGDLTVAVSNKNPDLLIPVYGQGVSVLRANPVEMAKVLPDSASGTLAELSKQTNTQQVALNTLDPVEQNPTRGGRIA
jgi:hypothetical protein